MIGQRFRPQAGDKWILMENGSRIRFNAPAVPTAAQPTVNCTAQPGAPFFVQWSYDAARSAWE